jgi:hypothetical protein
VRLHTDLTVRTVRAAARPGEGPCRSPRSPRGGYRRPMSAWVDRIFKAKQVSAGGVVRRSERNVQRHEALPEIIDRARSHGWHVIETGDQIVVLCHEGNLVIHC